MLGIIPFWGRSRAQSFVISDHALLLVAVFHLFNLAQKIETAFWKILSGHPYNLAAASHPYSTSGEVSRFHGRRVILISLASHYVKFFMLLTEKVKLPSGPYSIMIYLNINVCERPGS